MALQIAKVCARVIPGERAICLWPLARLPSLGCRYLHVCGDRRFNKHCFISLLDLRRPATRAAAGAVLVHLRTGDMLVRGDCAAEPPCLHDGKATPTAAGYRSILPRLPLPNASSVTVVYSSHFQLPPERRRSAGEAEAEAAARMYSARSDGYALAVGRVFEAAGHEVRYRRTEAASSSADAAASADADILSAAAAGTFVQSSGRYSMLMGAVAAAAGAKVVTVPTRASRSQSRSRSQSPPRASSAAAAPQLAAPLPDATPLPAFVVSTEERLALTQPHAHAHRALRTRQLPPRPQGLLRARRDVWRRCGGAITLSKSRVEPPPQPCSSAFHACPLCAQYTRTRPRGPRIALLPAP